MINFRNVDKDNFHAVIELEMHEDQMGFVEDNLFSLAECTVEESFVTKAVYNDDELVGFILYYFVEADPDYVFLHRIMIDKSKQGQGLGRETLEAAMILFKKEFPSIGCVELIHYPDNERGAAVYEKAGFKLTGDVYKSEPGRIERGTKNKNRYFEVVRRRYYNN